MQAIAARCYGPADVLRLEDAPLPVPGRDDVLLSVRAAGVNALDWRLLRGRPAVVRLFFGLRRPKDPFPGRDVAGYVEAVGADVTRFQPGDAVFGACRGAFAQYACSNQGNLQLKPPGVSFEAAGCTAIAGLTALQGVRDAGRLRAGERVLVNGASGGVGSFAVQVAKAFGAHVTGVCSSRNLALVRALGADAAIDYAADDFTRLDLAPGERFDLVFDCIGNHPPEAVRRVLAPGGRYVSAGVASGALWPVLLHALRTRAASLRGRQRFVSLLAKSRGADLAVLRDLLASGQLAPHIERTFALHEAAEAVRHAESGRTRGKIVIVPAGAQRSA